MPQKMPQFTRFLARLVWFIIKNKAAPFVLGLIFSLSLLEYTLVGVMMNHLTNAWKLHLPHAAAIINVSEGFTSVLSLYVTHISDYHIGHFQAVLYSNAIYVSALLVLRLLAGPPIDHNIKRLYLALGLVSVGKAGSVPLKALIDDQLRKWDQLETGTNLESKLDLWWNIPWIAGVFAATYWKAHWMAYVTGSAIVMIFSLLWFWFGKCLGLYEIEPVGFSPLAKVYYVIKASISKRKLSHPRSPAEFFHNENHHMPLLPDNKPLRWLDKAAINNHSIWITSKEQMRKKELFRVADVEEVKYFITMVPMWSTLLLYGVVESTGRTFFIDQATSTNKINNSNFPIEFFLVIWNVARFITSWLGMISTAARMSLRIGLGMMCCFLCCLVAYLVELRKLHHEISILCLIPQFVLLGAMGGLAEKGISKFFAANVSESMKQYGQPINRCIIGIGNFISALVIIRGSWFTDDLNTSRLDRYYGLLAMLSFGNIFIYGYVIRFYDDGQHQNQAQTHGHDVDGETSEAAQVAVDSSAQGHDVDGETSEAAQVAVDSSAQGHDVDGETSEAAQVAVDSSSQGHDVDDETSEADQVAVDSSSQGHDVDDETSEADQVAVDSSAQGHHENRTETDTVVPEESVAINIPSLSSQPQLGRQPSIRRRSVARNAEANQQAYVLNVPRIHEEKDIGDDETEHDVADETSEAAQGADQNRHLE